MKLSAKEAAQVIAARRTGKTYAYMANIGLSIDAPEEQPKARVYDSPRLLRAYNQGKRDALAGRRVYGPRYSDRERDEAWQKGYWMGKRGKK